MRTVQEVLTARIGLVSGYPLPASAAHARSPCPDETPHAGLTT